MALGTNELVPACPSNISTWTDSLLPVSSGLYKVRAVHVNELRAAVERENTRRRLSAATYEDDPVTSDVHNIRKKHVDDLVSAIERCKNAPDCATDTTPAIAWGTQPVVHSPSVAELVAGVTEIRAYHTLEMRQKVNGMEQVCVCDCNYCSCNCNCTCCDHSNCKSCTHGW